MLEHEFSLTSGKIPTYIGNGESTGVSRFLSYRNKTKLHGTKDIETGALYAPLQKGLILRIVFEILRTPKAAWNAEL